ncbi:MAG: amidohydrolase family protein [Chitinophaga sp.]|uniref:amidohydrolase family protein n=1 Tax=Chitinophaga sp. TaxID=1869181 RepID=UPI001B0CB01D|nr:amidohydrolase family protein [Chitinophaga sp.]MBO9732679.1 amidohydrolase family protein [Chitinophaga sp.]
MIHPLTDIPITDSHVHLWDPQQLEYPWLQEFPYIHRRYTMADYRQATEGVNVSSVVFVQAACRPDQYLREIDFVMQQAQTDERIRGIVAYAPLEQGRSVRNVFTLLAANPLVKGIRRMYDDDPSLCCSSAYLDAVQLLPEYGWSLDISAKPASLPATAKMTAACPDTVFILDHLGKPDIKGNGLDAFKRNIDQLAAFPNVYAKLSGLITEADPIHWTPTLLAPYINHAISCFGYERLLFGSDWPVVLLAGTYHQWLDALLTVLTNTGTRKELAGLFHENAQRIYRL